MTKPITESMEMIPGELIDRVRADLSRNVRVRHKLPGWGRIHIDRQLPFLCVYRRPSERPDAGTERLLLGEAAYILALGELGAQEGIRRLVKEVTSTQVASFGASLLIELWSAEDSTQHEVSDPSVIRPEFHLVVFRHRAPRRLLEELESALLGITIADQVPRVTLAYRDHITPPGLEPLISEMDADTLGVHMMGIEVSPVYRDAKSGELFPFELQELHHGLAHALKQGFYAYAHAYTTQRPAHYHELGRRAMTSDVLETDRQMAAISDHFDMLLHVTPVNAPAAWEEFRQRGFKDTPEFNYRPRPVDPDLLKRQLYQIPIEHIEDPTLSYIFSAKRDELDRQITMIADRNTSRFLRGSQQVYGDVEDWLLQLALQLVEQVSPDQAAAGEDTLLDAQAFADHARAELDHYRTRFPELPARVEVRDDITGVMVSQGHFLVGSDCRVTQDRVEATLSHEIGTHIVTYYNGRHQPFRMLYAGMANYEPLQEGLAVLSEYLVGKLDRSRLRLLAGRVLAVHSLTQGASFLETFQALTRNHGFGEAVAFNISMRVYRGGGFTKDAVYLRGLANLLQYLGDGGDLELLYLGKIALEHVHFVEELKWRQVFQPGPLRPRYLDISGSSERILRLQQGMSLAQLLEECER